MSYNKKVGPMKDIIEILNIIDFSKKIKSKKNVWQSFLVPIGKYLVRFEKDAYYAHVEYCILRPKGKNDFVYVLSWIRAVDPGNEIIFSGSFKYYPDIQDFVLLSAQEILRKIENQEVLDSSEFISKEIKFGEVLRSLILRIDKQSSGS